jgi:putative hydrolase of HD superfamily
VQQIIDFILELDKLKSVTRKVRPLGLPRYENSAEHSWQIAMLAAALVPYADATVDINRVIAMLLVHDIGEIDTGDTMVFVEGGWEERKAAELAAVTRIFGMLRDGRGTRFLELWKEFEDGKSVDALFSHAVDRAMPVLLNLANEGQSWRENGISYERVVARIGPEINAGCPALWKYVEERLEEVRNKGWFDATAIS